MKLLLGVNDVAYSGKEKTTTTGDVAEFLEDDYHVMETFYELNEEFISDELTDAIAGAIESLAQGRRGDVDASGPMSRIEERFRDYLDRGDWEKISGQTIDAAKKGISHRRKHPYSKRKSRRAFIDTGLYQAAFRAWLEG